MLRVYLDQNKWIDLSRSRASGSADELADVWQLAKAGVRAGLLSFPLSAVHFYETSKRIDQPSRWRLAATMAELSHMHAIAGPGTLIPLEVEAAVARSFPAMPAPPPIRAFGVGAAFALGADPATFTGMFTIEELEAVGMPADMLDPVRRGLVDPADLAVLARTEISEAARRIAATTRHQMSTIDRKFADGQRSFADSVKDAGINHLRDEGISRYDLADIMPLVNRAFVNRGAVLTPEQFRNIEVVEQLLQDVPSKWIVKEMRRVRHRNSQQRWTDSDLNDVNALSGAVVYCDVVVTERQWAHHLNQERLSELHHTTVLHDLLDLPQLIVERSAS